jgi:hypothetical protein
MNKAERESIISQISQILNNHGLGGIPINLVAEQINNFKTN